MTPTGPPAILVVDDDPVALHLAETLLKQLGFRPVCVPSAVAGLAAAAMEPMSAVVLDHVMPEMDGWEFLRRFRAAGGAARTPVIVWTARDLSAAERGALLASADRFVRKGDGSAALVEQLRGLATHDAATRKYAA